MIKLYQFAPVWGLPNASPFCMKVETYLRMAQLPYVPLATMEFRAAPTGKLPFIDDGGFRVGDSGFIVDYLKNKYGDKIDQGLTSAELATAHALRRMLEESLYWAAAYSRWGDAKNWDTMKSAFFASMSFPARSVAPTIARKMVFRKMRGQGITAHSAAAIYALGKADISALSHYLGDKPFFMGRHPASLDASAYAFLANILWVPIESPLKQHALSLANLSAYCERMRTVYYQDWQA